MNPTRTEEEDNIEDLLMGVYERMKENKVKEKKAKAKPYKENPNPFVPGEGDVLVATLNEEGVWEVV